MLEKLCSLNGVSGDEGKILDFILESVKDKSLEYKIFANGSLVIYKKGRKTPDKKLMVFAHTDEVGFIVNNITDEGFLKFDTVGGIDRRIILSKKVTVGDNKIPGIIGVKAVHLLSKEDRKKTIPVNEMYIDIGADSKEEAQKYVSLGDYVSFESDFIRNGKRIIAKALDDRIGVDILINLINSECEYDFTACFETLEEIGLMGAVTAANYEKPDYALVLEGTTCMDINDTPEHLRSTVLGNGPALSVRDMGTCYDRELNSFIEKTAEEKSIPYQYKQTHKGGNDSRVIQNVSEGVKTAVMSVPLRYIHAPAAIVDVNDYENGFRLAKAVVDNIGEI